KNNKGEYVTSALEYETIVLCGPNCDIDDLDTIALMDRLCDDLGVDTIETGATIAVCMDGGKIPWGDANGALGLIEEMMKGTDFGKLMGQGTKAVGEALGVKRIPCVKGQAMPAYDPRNLKGIGITYATSPMGADHTAGVTLMPGLVHKSKVGQVSLSQTMQTLSAVCDNNICFFAYSGILADNSILPDLIAGVYGGEWNLGKAMDIGVQTIMLEKTFNNKAGFTEKDDVLPEFLYKDFSPATGVEYDITPEEMAGVFKY
ncbi:MAG: aldehyde ferredoxin oxidoreductase C-terminal domain-containing protein, partial [Bacillota bacterium]|nr:aldehyde ferredoxin oxidoreductase C-terminal domain-containing protein [Bacillota bacterium]